MIPDNAWILRITAAAGTELADPYSHSTVKTLHVALFLPVQKQFTIHRTVILHAAWLDQACAHCPIFLTLPPVGVWSVSQYQCGGSPSQDPYPSLPWYAVTIPTS